MRGQRDWREIETLMRERERRDWDRLPSSAPSKQAGFEDYFRGSWYSFMLQMGPTPMMRFFWDFDVRPTYQHVRAPVLAVFGGADTMCAPDESAPALREALAHGGNRDVTVVVTPDADHFLQVTRLSKTDFAPGVVDRVVNWVAGRVGTARR